METANATPNAYRPTSSTAAGIAAIAAIGGPIATMPNVSARAGISAETTPRIVTATTDTRTTDDRARARTPEPGAGCFATG